MTIKIDGGDELVGEFAHTLRKQLYKEHLDLKDEEVEDPLCDDLHIKMKEIARVIRKIILIE